MLFIYRILINLIILFSPLIILVRVIKNKEDKFRFKEKFCFFFKKKRQWQINMVSRFKCWGNIKCNSFNRKIRKEKKNK